MILKIFITALFIFLLSFVRKWWFLVYSTAKIHCRARPPGPWIQLFGSMLLTFYHNNYQISALKFLQCSPAAFALILSQNDLQPFPGLTIWCTNLLSFHSSSPRPFYLFSGSSSPDTTMAFRPVYCFTLYNHVSEPYLLPTGLFAWFTV